MLGISSSIPHKTCGRKMIAECREAKLVIEVSQLAVACFSASSAAVSQRPPRFRTLLFLKFYPNLKTQRSLRRAAECAEIAIAREKRYECPTPFGTFRSSAQGDCFRVAKERHPQIIIRHSCGSCGAGPRSALHWPAFPGGRRLCPAPPSTGSSWDVEFRFLGDIEHQAHTAAVEKGKLTGCK
jgi:hypothetical protein